MSGHRVVKPRPTTFPEDARIIEAVEKGLVHQYQIVAELKAEFAEDAIVRGLKRLSKKGSIRYIDQKTGWCINSPRKRA